ncbi:MAG: helicase, partial [Streptosporangiaceae bacterium]|nr:helicase [Streptosporangiaceae bacterium]
AEMVGVELEPITAAIAAALYPDARILPESFADTHAPQGSFDLVVGNVPFAKATLTDPLYNRGKHSIHNHFIIKSLNLVAPGGLVALITSRYTLDSANPAARREIAGLADLVGAIRLPPSAHQRTAGTKVVTDLLVLRRREEDFEPAPVDWELTELADLSTGTDGQDSAPVRVNSYFLAHPEMVCGELTTGRGQFSDAELTVRAERPAAQLLAEKLDILVERAQAAELTHRPSALIAPAQRAALVGRRAQISDGYIAVDGQEFTQVSEGAVTPFAVPAAQRAELRALLGLRDGVVELLGAEAAALDSTPELDQLRTQLNSRYEEYVAEYGPINRFAWRRTGRTHPETGADLMARFPARQGGFRTDPHAPLVFALEEFDSATQRATKAAILTQRVVAPRTPRLGADSPEDALAICMDSHGRVELAEVARLLGVNEEEARAALGTLVFADPAQKNRLVPAAEYLSGNVREKLTAASAAAESSAEDAAHFGANIIALTEVIPPDIAPEDIVARLGAAWIDRRYVQSFLRETLQDLSLAVEHAYGSLWIVKGLEVGVNATSTWGTPDMPAPELAQKLLQQRPLTVYDETPAGQRMANAAKTVAAQAKGDELASRFAEWVWEEPARAIELARAYNDQFNAIVLRSYDEATLSLPGLALTFHPNPHQVAAVARMIAEPAVGLWHEVGAGKTAEMAMGVMELRRLGMVRKPVIVIPNHMIEQFSREFQQLYPRAKLLAASSADLTKDRRRAFVARVATGDWDAVIMTRGAFERIPMSPAAHGAYLDDQLALLRDAIERQKASGERSYSLKRMEKTLLNAEERMKDKLAREYDPAITFEKSGIDYLVVDEAQDYKNLRTPSNIAGAEIDGSARASDMEMKLHYLRRRHPGGSVVTFATATPIANSITEGHVMQRYLRPDLLEAAGVLDFDSWAATFGQTVAEVEVSPDGSEFRIKSRFARFHNVPELLRMWWVSGDVKTAEDLNLPRPELIARPGDGQRAPQTITIAPTPELSDFIAELAARAERVKTRAVAPNEDNMLMIAGDGRSAALDLRLVGEHMAPGEAKLEVAAAKIAEIWARHREDRFTDTAGNPHPVPGALQIVFCDLSTPREDRWNVYSELRQQLAARGVPAETVRFIHEARNDREKAELFQACRIGQVSVLIGSTSKMGTGTNVQTRAVALHHLDCPWRPADLTQRDGRALRRGNQYSEIGLYRYVVEGSFDAYSWQTVARKAAFIAQIMRGRLDVREIEDVGDSALSYNEVKALAAGNPLLLDKAKADAELTRLDRLERSHVQARTRLRYSLSQNEHDIAHTTTTVATLEQAIAARRDTRADRFAMTVDGLRFTDRTEAGSALRARLLSTLSRPGPSPLTIPAVANLGGLVFDATIWRTKTLTNYDLVISGIPAALIRGSATELTEAKLSSLPIRMENRIATLDKLLDKARHSLDTWQEEIARAEEQLDRPFPYAAELDEARQRCAELDEQLMLAATPEPTSASADPAVTTVAPPSPAAGPVTHPAMAAAATIRGPHPASARPRSAPATAPTSAPHCLPGHSVGPAPRGGNGGKSR